jgi:hypothetical protein
LGRYAGDVYDGDVANSSAGDHPWALCTCNLAELYYTLANQIQKTQAVPLDQFSTTFFSQIGVTPASPVADVVTTGQLGCMNDGIDGFRLRLQKELGLSISPKDPLLAQADHVVEQGYKCARSRVHDYMRVRQLAGDLFDQIVKARGLIRLPLSELSIRSSFVVWNAGKLARGLLTGSASKQRTGTPFSWRYWASRAAMNDFPTPPLPCKIK